MWNSVGQWGSAFHTRYEVLTAMKIQVIVLPCSDTNILEDHAASVFTSQPRRPQPEFCIPVWETVFSNP